MLKKIKDIINKYFPGLKLLFPPYSHNDLKALMLTITIAAFCLLSAVVIKVWLCG